MPAQDPSGPKYLSFYTDALDAVGLGYDVYARDHRAPHPLGVLGHSPARAAPTAGSSPRAGRIRSCARNAATGSSGGWQDWKTDLSDYAGKEIEVSILVATDPAVLGLGAWVDDAKVTWTARRSARRPSRTASARGR